MKILKITNQNRRDFSAELVCEGCGHVQMLTTGYDDRNYHDNVIPTIKCGGCGKTRNDLGVVGETVATKYEAWETV